MNDERNIAPFEIGRALQPHEVDTVDALAASFRGQRALADIQSVIEGIDQPDMRSQAYLNLAWGLHVTGGNPDPFILQANNFANEYREEELRRHFNHGELSQNDKERIFNLKFDVAAIAVQRRLPLASDALGDAYETVQNYESKENVSGLKPKDLRTEERLDSNETRNHIYGYVLKAVPALLKIVELAHDHPDQFEIDPRSVLEEVESIMWDERIRSGWPPQVLAQCAESMLQACIRLGDSEGVERIMQNVRRRISRGNMDGSDEARIAANFVKAEVMAATFNRGLASRFNFEDLTEVDIEDVIISGNGDAQKKLGSLMEAEHANEVLERDDVGDLVKANIIEGLELRLEAEEASARNTRLLLEKKRKDLKNQS